MSRRRRAELRKVLPDPKFGDIVLTKFMNYVMYEGKKAVAENIIYGAFDLIETRRRDLGPLETFHSALDNVAPSVEVALAARRRRDLSGGLSRCASSGARRWADPLAGQQGGARKRGENTMTEKAGRRTARRVQQPRLSGQENAKNTHKMAEANRGAFSHYRW